MKNFLFALLLILLAFKVNGAFRFLKEFNQNVYPTQSYKCFQAEGNDRIIMYLYSAGFGQDMIKPCLANIYNAKNAGLLVEVIYIRSRKYTIQQQVDSILKYFGTEAIQMFWLMPIFPQSSQDSASPQQNCAYLQNLVKLFKESKLNSGIMTESDQWAYQVQSCTELGASLLWWVPDDDHDKTPNFDNYVKFGGWETPFMKWLNSLKTICGIPTVINYIK